MKNIFSKLLILGIIISSNVFVGCNKDEATEKNKITLGTKSYSLSKGYQQFTGTIENESPKSDVYEFDIMLVGSGLSYDSETKNITGQGDYLFLTMYSLNAESLAPGFYTFDRFLSQDSLTIDYGVMGIDTVFSLDLGGNEIFITSGVVEVKKIGNIYQIDFDLYTEDYKQIVGSYSGVLENFNLLEQKSETSYLNFQSVDYPLNYGVLNLIDASTYDPVIYAFDLSLVGQGITFDSDLGELIGKGNLIDMIIFSTNPDSLKAGTYVFDEMGTTAPFTFTLAAVGINYDFSSESEDGIFIINSGTITISRVNDKYSIVFDVIAGSNIQAKGQYNGVLDFHDLSKKKSSSNSFKMLRP